MESFLPPLMINVHTLSLFLPACSFDLKNGTGLADNAPAEDNSEEDLLRQKALQLPDTVMIALI